ncbi:glycosyltransferase [Flavivirga abyssicola]|uniref:glycosyltransferase family 4 protein n=1 Tax=Flavivirga abyssicola TaxID=3063533 RepID=UPI0026DF0C6C|nr:glycosyltransferase [Flavivirga sp. MEBiC07777]WVK13624.1 glycosyltransferase [Flavivirga sp. MEBiC07777]
MKFLIITHVQHKLDGKIISAYGPYVREMNLWLKHVDEVQIVAPIVLENKNAIDLDYKHSNFSFKKIPSIQFTSIKKAFISLIRIPFIFMTIFQACRKADHIHLRCPGNIGLLGCLVQIFFPNKIKTAKYAGNWDSRAKQPLSYRFQKWMLTNTFFTKNMTALVYGDWQNKTQNIKSFFTATYSKSEIEVPKIRDYSKSLEFLFIGSLVEGKRPMQAIKIIESLHKQGRKVSLNLYGEGILKEALQNYIDINKLKEVVRLYGNKEKRVVKEALKRAHFLILPSKSEGWPKAVAEAMFFGTIPIVTSISCVPFMLDYGERGILIESDLNIAVNTIKSQLEDKEELQLISNRASTWSQNYTLDTFEDEIIKLLKP